MTEELSPRELELLKPYLKLIDNQAKEITQLGMEVDTLRYNKRFTNTKYVKNEINAGLLVGLEPKSYPKPNPKKVGKK
jgi:hypothetical protein